MAPRFGGRVRVDLRHLDENEAGRMVKQLTFAPAGADVTVTVSADQIMPFSALDLLRDQGQHLGEVLIESDDPAIVKQWVQYLRGESIA